MVLHLISICQIGLILLIEVLEWVYAPVVIRKILTLDLKRLEVWSINSNQRIWLQLELWILVVWEIGLAVLLEFWTHFGASFIRPFALG